MNNLEAYRAKIIDVLRNYVAPNEIDPFLLQEIMSIDLAPFQTTDARDAMAARIFEAVVLKTCRVSKTTRPSDIATWCHATADNFEKARK